MIDNFHKSLLSLILKNKYVASNITLGNVKVEFFEIKDDGSIRLYTKNRPFKWLCILFNDYKDLSFRELALELIDVIAGPNNLMNNRVFDGMTKEFMEKAVRNKQYDYIVDMLFDVLRYGLNDGDFNSQYLSFEKHDREERQSSIGRFNKQQAYCILNSGEAIGQVDVYTRIPQ